MTSPHTLSPSSLASRLTILRHRVLSSNGLKFCPLLTRNINLEARSSYTASPTRETRYASLRHKRTSRPSRSFIILTRQRQRQRFSLVSVPRTSLLGVLSVPPSWSLSRLLIPLVSPIPLVHGRDPTSCKACSDAGGRRICSIAFQPDGEDRDMPCRDLLRTQTGCTRHAQPRLLQACKLIGMLSYSNLNISLRPNIFVCHLSCFSHVSPSFAFISDSFPPFSFPSLFPPERVIT